MAWTWLVTFIPMADEIIGGINKIIKGRAKRKEVEASVKKSIVDLYKMQYSSINRDITLIKSFKPITSKIQAIDIVLRRWEYLCVFCEKNNIENLVPKFIDEKKIDVLKSITKDISKSMDKFSKEAEISWNEGGPNLKTALSNLEDKIDDLKTDYLKDDKKTSNLIINTRQAQEETKYFFSFWDEVLKTLVKESHEASLKFTNSLDSTLKKQIKLIEKEYSSEDWNKTLKDTLAKIEDLNNSDEEE